MFQKVSNKSGFSLVELMVVVAIIGILASLAIPQVTKFQAKARQSEAKSMLSTLYSSEKAFFAEYSAYHSAFKAVGFSPEGALRYNVGFGPGMNTGDAGAANGYNTAIVAGDFRSTATYCGAGGTFTQGCTVLVGTTNAAPQAILLTATATVGYANNYTFVAAGAAGACEVPAVAATGASFLACATAAVYNNNLDFWTMDQTKRIANISNGIP